MIVVLGIVAAVANLFDKEDDTIKKGHDCSTCTEADEGNCKIHELMEHCKKAKKLTIIISALLILAGCSTQKNTAKSRWWHSFNTRYNVYFNGSQAFIEGNLEKEKGNKDNYTEMLPLYMVVNGWGAGSTTRFSGKPGYCWESRSSRKESSTKLLPPLVI